MPAARHTLRVAPTLLPPHPLTADNALDPHLPRELDGKAGACGRGWGWSQGFVSRCGGWGAGFVQTLSTPVPHAHPPTGRHAKHVDWALGEPKAPGEGTDDGGAVGHVACRGAGGWQVGWCGGWRRLRHARMRTCTWVLARACARSCAPRPATHTASRYSCGRCKHDRCEGQGSDAHSERGLQQRRSSGCGRRGSWT